ncbi:MAG TPA: heparinase II/III family protein [Mycobacteriales bacterium]|nr:heparinase II/III family protein [Mycobacteriales bacterium]
MTQFVEKPPHVHPTRMRDITADDLLAALGGGADLPAWRQKLANGRGHRPVWDDALWASWARGRPAGAAAVDSANELCGRTVDFLDPGHGRSRLYGFHYLGWLAPLIAAHALTADPKYAAEWERFFGQWYAGRNRVVGEWPGLDVVWYSLGVAARSALTLRALAVFGSAVSDQCWHQMLATVLGGARWAAEEHDGFRPGNWQVASCAELLHAATVLPEFAEAGQWAAIAETRLLEHLERDVHPDGGHHERSPGYHAMCLNAFQRAAVVNERIGAHPRFRAMHDWLIRLADPSGWIPAFQDSGVIWPATLLLRGHHLLGDPVYKGLAARWLSPERLAEELSWLPPRSGRPDPAATFHAAPAAEPGTDSSTLDTSGYTIMRTGWGADDLLTVINFGPYVGHELEPHSHHAALDFVISGWGRPLAWEAGGPPSYDDPAYYDWYQATRGHNAVVVPGAEFHEDRNARQHYFRTGPDVEVFLGSEHGYQREHSRQIVFVRRPPRYWLITDGLAGPESSVEWLLHAPQPWRPHENGFAPEHGPGLLAVPVDSGPVQFRDGRARIPDPQVGTAEFGELHTLVLERPSTGIAVLLAPFETTPPPVHVQRKDGGIDIRIGDVTDRITAREWTRDGHHFTWGDT